MNVTLFDYGAGNLHSLAKALERAGARTRIEADPVRALDTQALVLPGVGAFGAAAERLAPGRDAMRAALERGLPCLGVCLGMQLLFESSDEGEGAGLGLLAGRVRRLTSARTPHMGWNDVTPVVNAVEFPTLAYFAHSYVCEPLDARDVAAYTTHESDRFASAVLRARTLGVQFHPEKSGPEGLRLLSSWLAWAAREVPTCS
jgi:glutamine amidotransferase